VCEEGTDDRLLGGRVRLCQPRRGYRVAIDPVVLAAAVVAGEGQSVLDVGCGVGAAALCLAARVPQVAVFGIDADADAVRLANANAQRNAMADRVRFRRADVRAATVEGMPDAFDHVMTNPPYLRPGAVRQPQHAGRRRAMVEGDVPLATWLRACVDRLAARGRLTLIHRADRLADVLIALDGVLGELAVLPLWPAACGTRPAGRIVVSGRRGSSAPIRLLPGLVLHSADGGYTDAAEAVLRAGAGLRW
jgi:tRNA1(Val) A37 N6-methylase TrmN6